MIVCPHIAVGNALFVYAFADLNVSTKPPLADGLAKILRYFRINKEKALVDTFSEYCVCTMYINYTALTVVPMPKLKSS